jgi:tRNA threonylcarbamoyladenosine biosynthesis protein TsaE
MELSVSLPAAEDTDALGAALARSWNGETAVVYLRGELGAGKSTLARALLRALGVEGAIRSPTYTLVERYPIARGEAVHLDLYRIGAPGELEFLGLEDLRAEAALWLVEWPERGGAALPPADLEIGLEREQDGRRAGLHAGSEKGRSWLEQLSKTAASSACVQANPRKVV